MLAPPRAASACWSSAASRPVPETCAGRLHASAYQPGLWQWRGPFLRLPSSGELLREMRRDVRPGSSLRDPPRERGGPSRACERLPLTLVWRLRRRGPLRRAPRRAPRGGPPLSAPSRLRYGAGGCASLILGGLPCGFGILRAFAGGSSRLAGKFRLPPATGPGLQNACVPSRSCAPGTRRPPERGPRVVLFGGAQGPTGIARIIGLRGRDLVGGASGFERGDWASLAALRSSSACFAFNRFCASSSALR